MSFSDIEFPILILSSVIATATFFTTGVMTAQVLHRGLPPVDHADWTLGMHGKTLLAFQAIPLTFSTLLFLFVCAF